MYFRRGGEVAAVAKDDVKMSIVSAHKKLGHCGEDMARKTAKILNWLMMPETMPTCDACMIGKAKQKNLVKASEGKPAETISG